MLPCCLYSIAGIVHHAERSAETCVRTHSVLHYTTGGESGGKQGTHRYGVFTGRMKYHDGDMIAMSEFKVRGSTTDTKEDATDKQMEPFGICKANFTVSSIKELTRKELMLESNYATLTSYKF